MYYSWKKTNTIIGFLIFRKIEDTSSFLFQSLKKNEKIMPKKKTTLMICKLVDSSSR